MSATTSTEFSEFSERVQALIAGMDGSGLIDRYAANDVLLDLLEAAGTGAESERVLGALAALPKSSLVDRAILAGLLAGLCSPSQN
ncbi:MAG: hypothetical protein ACRDY7_00095 [Acidimicrobiia bacterium]